MPERIDDIMREDIFSSIRSQALNANRPPLTATRCRAVE
jgi:hypothetical protein